MLSGNDGNDRLEGGAGNDSLDGGAGDDVAIFAGNAADYTVTDNMDGTFTVIDNVGTDGTDTLSNIELLRFADGTLDMSGGTGGMIINGTLGDDVLNGTDGDDTITGFEGNDTINAGAGDDLIILDNSGQDTVDGGVGFDTVQFTNTGTASGVFFNSPASATFLDIVVLSLTGGFSQNLLSNVERFEQYDPSGNLQILALNLDASDNVLDLSSEGILGQALVFGGDGNDIITAGSGYDGTVDPNNILNPIRANDLRGGDGNDTITGSIHDDFISGNAGADVLDGGDGIDTVVYRFSDSGVTVNLSTQTASGGTATGDDISNFENVDGSNDFGDILTGSSGNNRLDGLGGNNIIDGGDGDDVIFAGDGNDTLTGGAGNDQITAGGGDDTLSGG